MLSFNKSVKVLWIKNKYSNKNNNNSDNILCKFCCDLESLKKHFYVNHRNCMPCERSFEDNDGTMMESLTIFWKNTIEEFNVNIVLFFYFDPNKLDIHVKNCWNNNDTTEVIEGFEDFEIWRNILWAKRRRGLTSFTWFLINLATKYFTNSIEITVFFYFFKIFK